MKVRQREGEEARSEERKSKKGKEGQKSSMMRDEVRKGEERNTVNNDYEISSYLL